MIYVLMGRGVIRLALGTGSSGYYEAAWRVGEMLGRQFSPGVYISSMVPLKCGKPIKACPEPAEGHVLWPARDCAAGVRHHTYNKLEGQR